MEGKLHKNFCNVGVFTYILPTFIAVQKLHNLHRIYIQIIHMLIIILCSIIEPQEKYT